MRPRSRNSMGFVSFVVASSALTLSACTGRVGEVSATPDAGFDGLPCEVVSVLTTRCVSCHGSTPSNGAPFSLVSRADLLEPSPGFMSQTKADRSLARMQAATMPPFPNAAPTDAEVAAFKAWVEGGAQQGQCSGVDSDAGATYAFEPASTAVAVSKVKNLLIGTAATDDEVAAVDADQTALKTYANGWFLTDEAQAKLFVFFQKAFQQTQIGVADFTDQGGLAGSETAVQAPLSTALQESFARTAKKLVRDGAPFTETLTTSTFMMNPEVMSFYLYIDQNVAGTVWPNGATTLDVYATYYGHAPTAADYQRALSPTCQWPNNLDANGADATGKTCYLHFPIGAALKCVVPQQDPITHRVLLDAAAKVITKDVFYNESKIDPRPSNVYNLVLGKVFLGLPTNATACALQYPMPTDAQLVDPSDPKYAGNAALYANDLKAAKAKFNVDLGVNPRFDPTNVTFPAADWAQGWRMVKVRQATASDPMLPFWDFPSFRDATELPLHTPRVGAFTTPAFFANWPTNQSNQSRDVTNQTLVVGIGRSINPVDKGTGAVLDDGNDNNHSDPLSPCYSCHQVLDPMRTAFRKFYDYSYHRQTNEAFSLSTFDFGFQGVTKKNLVSLNDFAQTLVEHPLYATAWAQKLCYYANSAPCSEDDPEFKRVVKAFVGSSYNFHTLVVELFTSPLVTGLAETKTLTDRGDVVSIARLDHLCASLSNRFKLAVNLCTTAAGSAVSIRSNIPADGYLRGAESPVLSTDPTMFFRSAAESLCRVAADAVVDFKVNGDVSKSFYQSSKKDEAINDLVGRVMGVNAADPAAGPLLNLLKGHYEQALVKHATPTDALKSTVVTACLSPSSLAMGL